MSKSITMSRGNKGTMDSNRYTLSLSKHTETETDLYRIEWHIQRFRQLLTTNAMTRGYRTPRYTVVEVPDTPFQLKVAFFGIDSRLMEIYYLTTKSSIINLVLQVRYGIHSQNLSYEYQTVPSNEWQCVDAIDKPHQIPMTNTNEFSFLPTADTFAFHMCFLLTVSHAKGVDCQTKAVTPLTSQLTVDFGALLIDTSFSDVIMKSVEGAKFKAHKSVLAVRSKVLRAHFEHNTKESITNVVETSWETEVLGDLLTFVYTDKVPEVIAAPDKLLVAADYYQLDSLKRLCEEVLHKRLTVENAIDTLQLAELYSLSSLWQQTLSFINERYILVRKTEGWKNIQSVEFIQKIYDFIMSDTVNDIDVDILAAAFDELDGMN
ncbi:Roadkill [Operophtera brumata]|uniref:Roadkill n=1 Tax=Operophtera brumata TaxID=104452 RepID=A0A0L7KKQ4_OPEBR|nr:Roadkill [Operophtera brumata]